MATKKQKREAGIAKREAEEKERRERGLHFLSLAQQERIAQKKKADEAALARKKKVSKRLAKQHKQGVQTYKPAEKNVIDILRPKKEVS